MFKLLMKINFILSHNESLQALNYLQLLYVSGAPFWHIDWLVLRVLYFFIRMMCSRVTCLIIKS